MSDFMIWLYAHYIKPQLDAAPQGDYSFHFDLMHNELGFHALESYEKSRECPAFRAFLRPRRAGRSLPRERLTA